MKHACMCVILLFLSLSSFGQCDSQTSAGGHSEFFADAYENFVRGGMSDDGYQILLASATSFDELSTCYVFEVQLGFEMSATFKQKMLAQAKTPYQCMEIAKMSTDTSMYTAALDAARMMAVDSTSCFEPLLWIGLSYRDQGDEDLAHRYIIGHALRAEMDAQDSALAVVHLAAYPEEFDAFVSDLTISRFGLSNSYALNTGSLMELGSDGVFHPENFWSNYDEAYMFSDDQLIQLLGRAYISARSLSQVKSLHDMRPLHISNDGEQEYLLPNDQFLFGYIAEALMRLYPCQPGRLRDDLRELPLDYDQTNATFQALVTVAIKHIEKTCY